MNPSTEKDLFAVPMENTKKLQLVLHRKSIPSFKNSKMILGIRREKDAQGNLTGKWLGTPFIATNTEYKHAMQEIIQSIVSQCVSKAQALSGPIPMGHSRLSWIASFMPEDDSRSWIKSEEVIFELVPAGQECIEIEIEKIS